MTSKPPQPTPEWARSGPASSAPFDARAAAADGFGTGPQDGAPGGPGRWPTPPAPRPGPGNTQSADRPPPGTEPQPRAEASRPGPAEPGDERLATLSYLGVPFLGPLVPLAVYLFKGRASAFARSHSAQALNLSVTALLYGVCALILGTMLALDSIVVALIVVVPLAVALWLITLGYVIVAGSAANRGDYYPVPGWLCATIVR
jgi:uncharacterized protein